jgi:hypothetical protein
MKNLLLTLLFGFSFSVGATAQSSSVSSQNADAVRNYDGIMGHFDYVLNSRETMNVNYALTPKNLVNTAHLMLHTPDPMPLSAKIMDAAGKVVLTWVPETKVYLYNTELNIASLASGVYTVHFYMGTDSKSIYNFNFNKQ